MARTPDPYAARLALLRQILATADEPQPDVLAQECALIVRSYCGDSAVRAAGWMLWGRWRVGWAWFVGMVMRAIHPLGLHFQDVFSEGDSCWVCESRAEEEGAIVCRGCRVRRHLGAERRDQALADCAWAIEVAASYSLDHGDDAGAADCRAASTELNRMPAPWIDGRPDLDALVCPLCDRPAPRVRASVVLEDEGQPRPDFSPPPGWPESAGWVPCDREDAALVYVPGGGTARYYRREAKP